MSLQNKAGSIILDATLTDVGRRHMANGKFEITKFSLADDEIIYTQPSGSAGEYVLVVQPPTFEAICEEPSALKHGLMDIGSRNDVLYMPDFALNTKIKNAVTPYKTYIYLSVNDETTEKLSTAIDFNTYILQNESEKSNMIVYESGIGLSGSAIPTNPVEGTQLNKERYLYNLKLYDDYAFVYADSRFFDKVMSGPMSETSVFLKKITDTPTYTAGTTIQPLVPYHKVSLTSPAKNYDSYYCKTSYNNIYDGVAGVNAGDFSMFLGPRGCFIGLNFKVNPKMKARSNGVADVRYTKFGKTAQNLFSDGNLYDYVDTKIMIEGASSMRTIVTKVRIVRFSGT